MNDQATNGRNTNTNGVKIAPRATGASLAARRRFLQAAAALPIGAALAAPIWTNKMSGGAAVASPRRADVLAVHEWGTFTALQDERGRELIGVNVDDEPVPDFVHRLKPPQGHLPLLLNPRANFTKGLLRPPQYVMRLETPVIYFYPPAGATEPIQLDVDVQFRGGWLSEFYPQADAVAPGHEKDAAITPATIGSLSWKGLKVGVSQPGPATGDHVWAAPRRVRAAQVAMPNGEAEKYLFYRGVGAIRAPLRVTVDAASGKLRMFSNLHPIVPPGEAARFSGAWLVQIRADGATAFRELGALTASADSQRQVASTTPFREADFSSDNLYQLQSSMRAALVADGLFDDEAEAMLATWEYSYFQSPGLRLFFLLPRKWTDHHLPLTLSQPADVVRVMVGRIELITADQRRLIQQIAAGPTSDKGWLSQIPESANRDLFFAGKAFGDLGVAIPADYQAYLDLGRFRNALLAAEAKERPTPSLQQFMSQYRVVQSPQRGVALDQPAT